MPLCRVSGFGIDYVRQRSSFYLGRVCRLFFVSHCLTVAIYSCSSSYAISIASADATARMANTSKLFFCVTASCSVSFVQCSSRSGNCRSSSSSSSSGSSSRSSRSSHSSRSSSSSSSSSSSRGGGGSSSTNNGTGSTSSSCSSSSTNNRRRRCGRGAGVVWLAFIQFSLPLSPVSPPFFRKSTLSSISHGSSLSQPGFGCLRVGAPFERPCLGALIARVFGALGCRALS